MTEENHKFGAEVPNWQAPPRPGVTRLEGRYALLEPLSAAHAADIHAANSVSDSIWDYITPGPFDSEAAYRDWAARASTDAQRYYAIRNNETGRFEGVASFMRMKPDTGSIEVGSINFSKPLQRTRAATEAMYLMMRWVFEAGYRRYEWKCNSRNLPSRRAAERFGFSYEGIFRQAVVEKGRNRDTAWFACIDAEWPALSDAYEAWLDPSNFTADGQQVQSLRAFTKPILVARDPAVAR
ncbi:MAG: GNAT family protein [Pseudomonadota bacterium]